MGNGKKLSRTEEIIMKIIWSSTEEMSMTELTQELGRQCNREYARTTVVTFISRIAEKGFVTSVRKGRHTYLIPLKTEEEYLQSYFADMLRIWFNGDKAQALQFMIDSRLLKLKDKQKVIDIVNDLAKKSNAE